MYIKTYSYLFSLLIFLIMWPLMGMREGYSISPSSGVIIKKQKTNRSKDTIWWAASKGNVALVQYWIDKDSSLVDALDDKFAEAPLYWAVKHNHEEVIRCLLDADADVNIVSDRSGKTPLFWATCVPCVKLLLRYGALVNVQDHDRKTPMHWADDSAIVGLLIEAGADVHLQDSEGKDALQWAAGKGNSKVVAQLLAAGSDINSIDKKGKTALHSAVFCGNFSLVEFLLAQNGIEVDARDFIKLRTPLQWALRMCRGTAKKDNEQNSICVTARIIVALVKHGADRYSLDQKHRAPEYWIKRMRCSEDEKALLRKAVQYQTLRNAQKQELLNALENFK